MGARRKAEPPLLKLAREGYEKQDTRPRLSRMHLRLPFPPSVNHVYRSWAVGKRVMVAMTPEGTAYKEAVSRTIGVYLGGYRPPDPTYSLVIWAYPPDRREHDVDNMLKVSIDAIFEAIEANDNDIVYLQISKPSPAEPPTGDPHINIVLEGEGDL